MPSMLFRVTLNLIVSFAMTAFYGFAVTPAGAQDVFVTTSGSLGTVVGDAYIGIDNYRGSQTINTSPTVTLDVSGSVTGDLSAYNHSHLDLTGGSANSLSAYDDSALNVTGGGFNFVFGADSSTVVLHGATISDSVYAYDRSTFRIDGGTLEGSLYAFDNSILNLYGSGLSASLISLDDGGFSLYRLEGMLNDQSSVSGKNLYVAVNQYGNIATVNLYNPTTTITLTSVPESGLSVLLLTLIGTGGSLSFFIKRRK